VSIIYEALKKIEGKKNTLPLEDINESVTFPMENVKNVEETEKIEKKVSKGKKMFSLPVALLLAALGLSILSFILSSQKQDGEAMVVKKNEIDPARVYKIPESNNQALEEVTLRENFVKEYILEGIVYDQLLLLHLLMGRLSTSQRA